MGTCEGFNSQLLSQSISLSDLVPGEAFTVSFTLRNVSIVDGMYTWRPYIQGQTFADQHYLSASNSLTAAFGVSRVDLNEYISPYGYSSGYAKEKTFTLSLVAPNNVGTHTLRYRMKVILWDSSNGALVGTHQFFGATVSFNVIVRELPNSQLISIEYPETMEIVKRGTALVTLKNTGIWPWNSTFRLEYNNNDTLQFSRAWFYVPLGITVNPGDTYTFRIPIRAPAVVGTYNPCLRMWWNRCGKFGANCCDTVVVTKPMSSVQDLNDYQWENMSARRTTADIAWQYTINLNGTEKPPDFGRLYHEIDGLCALHGELTEYDIDFDYPKVSTILTAYSFGYFLNNRVPVKFPGTEIYLRQSRAGSDIRGWQIGESNQGAIQAKTDPISTYENPTHYLKRILFYVDDSTGKVDTTRAGPYGLWATDTFCSSAEQAVTGGIPTIRPVPNWGIASGQAGFNQYHPTTEDPFQIEKKQFAFDGEKIIDVLDELAEHCHMLYYTRFIKVDGLWREYFYWIPKYGVALGWLGVSQTVENITPQALGLIGSPGLSASIVLEQSYNAVWVEACRKKDSAWFYSYKPGAGVVAGTESPRVLFYRSHDMLPDPAGNNWSTGISAYSNFGPGGVNYGSAAENANCQSLVDAKAQSLVDLLEYQIPTFTVTFQDRFFELYQVLNFSGFAGLTAFNGFDMQIIDIEYQYNPPSDGGHSVTITVAPKAELQSSGKFQSVIDEIQENFEKLKEDISSGNTDDKVANIISTYDQGTMCNAQLRSTGAMTKTRTYGYRTASG